MRKKQEEKRKKLILRWQWWAWPLTCNGFKWYWL